MKIKFNLDDELPLNKTVESPFMIIVTAISLKNDNYFPQVFLDEFLYKI